MNYDQSLCPIAPAGCRPTPSERSGNVPGTRALRGGAGAPRRFRSAVYARRRGSFQKFPSAARYPGASGSRFQESRSTQRNRSCSGLIWSGPRIRHVKPTRKTKSLARGRIHAIAMLPTVGLQCGPSSSRSSRRSTLPNGTFSSPTSILPPGISQQAVSASRSSKSLPPRTTNALMPTSKVWSFGFTVG